VSWRTAHFPTEARRAVFGNRLIYTLPRFGPDIRICMRDVRGLPGAPVASVLGEWFWSLTRTLMTVR